METEVVARAPVETEKEVAARVAAATAAVGRVAAATAAVVRVEASYGRSGWMSDTPARSWPARLVTRRGSGGSSNGHVQAEVEVSLLPAALGPGGRRADAGALAGSSQRGACMRKMRALGEPPPNFAQAGLTSPLDGENAVLF